MLMTLSRLTWVVFSFLVASLQFLSATDFTALDQGITTGPVNTIVADTAGGLYVGGNFRTITVTGSAPLTANSIAYWNGTAWSTLGGGVTVPGGVSGAQSGLVNAITQIGKLIFVAGDFTAVVQISGASLPCNNVAEWNGNLHTWNVVGQNSAGGGTNGPVNAMAYDTSLGIIWLGGNFTSVDNAGFSPLGTGYIAQYNPTSEELTPFASGTTGIVNAIAVDDGSTLGHSAYFGGAFTSNRLSPNNGFFKTTGGALATVPDLGETPVNALAVDASHEIYIGGNFQLPGSTPSKAIAMLTSTASGYVGLGTGLTSGVSLGMVNAILLPSTSNNPIIGGIFNSAGGATVGNLATWNATTSSWSSYIGSTDGAVQALAADSNGSVYVGGAFSTAVSPSASITSSIVRVGPSLNTALATTTGTTSTTATGSGNSTGGSTSSSGTGSTGTSTSTGNSSTAGTASTGATSAGATTAIPAGGSSSGSCGIGSSIGLLACMALLLAYRRSR